MRHPLKVLKALRIVGEEPNDEELLILTEEFGRAVMKYVENACNLSSGVVNNLTDEKVIEIVKSSAESCEIPIQKLKEVYRNLVEVYTLAKERGREEAAWRYLGFVFWLVSDDIRRKKFSKILKDAVIKEFTLSAEDSNLLEELGYPKNFYLYTAGVEVLNAVNRVLNNGEKAKLLESLSYYAPLREDLFSLVFNLEKLITYRSTKQYAIDAINRFKYAPYMGFNVLKTAAKLLRNGDEKTKEFLEIILKERDFEQIGKLLKIYTSFSP